MEKWRRYSKKTVPFLFQFLVFACYTLWQPKCANPLSADGATLLVLKSAISSDPQGLLFDWKDDGTDPCKWKGVGCDRFAQVVSLNLTSSAVCGPVETALTLCGEFKSEHTFLERVTRQESQTDPVLNTGKNTRHCKLLGSFSSAIGNLSQLRILTLPFNSFSGLLPKEIAGLRFLEVLDLRGNQFSGSIPAGFGQLLSLKILNLAYNSLEGDVPPELSGCKKLQVLNLAGNKLSGNIPVFVESFPELRVLELSFNKFGGTIPSEVARSCNNLEHFHLEDNFLSGTIPAGFGNCSRLRSLVLSSNFLSGPIPADIGQLQLLELLDVSRNSLTEDVPLQLGNCTQLSLLVLTNHLGTQFARQHNKGESKEENGIYEKDEHNSFSTLPSTIVNLPKLRILWAPRAALSAALPSVWGNCQRLEVLNLAGNSISGNFPGGTAKCKSLIYLDLSGNKLKGLLPQQLPIPCMVVFNVSGNSLSGGLPDWSGISCPTSELLHPHPLANRVPVLADDLVYSSASIHLYFSSLYCGNVAKSLPVWFPTEGWPIIHDMSENDITGPLPGLFVGVNLTKKVPAYGLLVSGNQLQGSMPSNLFELCQYFQTLWISLSKINLSQTLSEEAIVNCTLLRRFDVASNWSAGRIPCGLVNLNDLVYLPLGISKLGGNLPSQVRRVQELRYLFIANNGLTGRIPKGFGKSTSLVLLDLSGNKVANSNHLTELLLNNNILLGLIPFTRLNHLVAFNNLSSSMPPIGKLEPLCTSVRVRGSKYLESPSAYVPIPSLHQLDAHSPQEKKRQPPMSIFITAITSGCAIAAVIIILLVLFQCIRQNLRKQSGYQSGRKQVVTFQSLGFQLTYDRVISATGNFSLDNLIGNGGFGATYKAELMPGLIVAVKKLSLGKFQGTEQFAAEIRTLGRIQHPNLVTLIGYHASDSQMFLIYNYLPGGNLENLIHDGKRGFITWRVRYKIALDIAEALAYLHYECTPRVLHRDIKPSNVLLDSNLNAVLSDFGLARLLDASQTHATTDVAGTFGYVAPEYALTCHLSDKADVYSFGIVLLELLSGKRALDPSFSHFGHAFDIVAWAAQLFQNGQPMEIFAPGLWEQGSHSQLLDVLKLAVKCTVLSLSVRPSMKQVVNVLKSIC